VAIKCYSSDQWTKVLPTVLLKIRAAWKNNLQATIAELVYGEMLRLPGQFLSQPVAGRATLLIFSGNCVVVSMTCLIEGIRQRERKLFIFKDLVTVE